MKDQSSIKPLIEADAGLVETYARMDARIEEWWEVARGDFARLEGSNHLAAVRAELLTTIKRELVPIGALDEFQTAGVFVNWWQTIRYDLKTITSTGWSPGLIPDSYLIETDFQAEVKTIEELESRQGKVEAQLSETVEAVDYEAGEDEEVTVKAIKDYLKAQIKELKVAAQREATAEREKMEGQVDAIKKAEDRISEIKKALKHQRAELERKLRFKREGVEDEREELNKLVAQNERDTAKLKAADVNGGATRAEKKAAKEREKLLAALERDRETLRKKLAGLDAELAAIGGVIKEEEAKRLILKKLYDLINNELARYLNAEKRATIVVFEKLWAKYAVSAQAIEGQRAATIRELNDYLTKLGYLMEEFSAAQG